MFQHQLPSITSYNSMPVLLWLQTTSIIKKKSQEKKTKSQAKEKKTDEKSKGNIDLDDIAKVLDVK